MLGRTHCFLLLLTVSNAFGQSVIFCDLPAPLLSAETITCTTPEVQIHLANVKPDIQYQWFDEREKYLGELPPKVQKAGVYSVRSIERHTGCERTDNIEVKDNVEAPIAAAKIVTYTYAGIENYVLKAQEQPTKSLLFIWTFLSSQEQLVGAEVETQLIGPYLLKVIDVNNGCTASLLLEEQQNLDGRYIEK